MTNTPPDIQIITGTLTPLGLYTTEVSLFDASQGRPIMRDITRTVIMTDKGENLVVEAAGRWTSGDRISGVLNGMNREGNRLVLFPVALVGVFNREAAIAQALQERAYYAMRAAQPRAVFSRPLE